MGAYRRRDSRIPWWISYTYQGRQIREPAGPTKKIAEEALAARRADIARDKFDLHSLKPSPSFTRFASTYLEHARANKKSWDRDRIIIDHLTQFFGNTPLHRINPFLIEQYKRQRRGEVSPATVNRELGCLKHMFNLAIEWGKAGSNPVDKVKFFREERGPVRWLSEDEAESLIAAAGEHLKPILIVALHTGMRRGELLSLKWNNVDLLNRTITVEHSKGGRIRQIPMTNRAFETLRGMDKPGDYVFANKDGGPYGKVQKGFKAALRRAGVRECRFHDLRHTFASWLVMRGVPLATVQYYLGHRDIQTTMAYSHLSPDHRREAIKALDYHSIITEQKPLRMPAAVSSS